MSLWKANSNKSQSKINSQSIWIELKNLGWKSVSCMGYFLQNIFTERKRKHVNVPLYPRTGLGKSKEHHICPARESGLGTYSYYKKSGC